MDGGRPPGPPAPEDTGEGVAGAAHTGASAGAGTPAGVGGGSAPAADVMTGGKGRRARRWRRRLAGVALVAVALVVVAVTLVAKTAPARRLALEAGLDRVRGRLAGELHVAGVDMPGWLGTLVLRGVTLTAEGDRRFLQADSVVVRTSMLRWLAGRPGLASVRVGGLRVEIARLPGEEVSNVARLLLPSPPTPDSTRAARPLPVGRLLIEGGRLDVVSPAGADEEGTEAAPGGGRVKRLVLDGVRLEVDRAVLTPTRNDLLSGFLAHFAASIGVGAHGGLEVVGAQGRLRFGRDGLALSDAFFRLPASVLSGGLEVGPRADLGGAWGFSADLETEEPASLRDLAWLDPRVPEGSLEGRFRVAIGPAVEVTLVDARAVAGGSALGGRGTLVVGSAGVEFHDWVVDASPLALSRLGPWLPSPPPMEGFLSGSLRLDGPWDAVRTRARLTLAPEGFGGRPTTVDASGTLHLGGDPGVTDLEGVVDPLNFALLGAFAPRSVPPARGRAELRATGRLEDGLRIEAEVEHRPDSAGPTDVRLAGSVRRQAGAWSLDLEGSLAPLSLDGLGFLLPGAGVDGSLEGRVWVRGPVRSLHVAGDLHRGEGQVAFDAYLDGRRPAGGYRLDARAHDLRLDDVVGAVPADSRVTGRLILEGRGSAMDSLTAVATLRLHDSRMAGVAVDSVRAQARVDGGLVRVDSLAVLAGGAVMRGGGTLSLAGDRSGRARFTVAGESLAGLRPLLRRGAVIARDTLSALDRQLLAFQGVDPDTLPLLEDVTLDGRLQAAVDVEGRPGAYRVRADATLLDARYGRSRLDSLDLHLQAAGPADWSGSLEGEFSARGIDLLGRSLSASAGAVTYGQGRGSARLALTGIRGEEVRVAGAVELEEGWRGRARIDTTLVRLDSLRYAAPAAWTLSWGGGSLAVDSLLLERAGDDRMRLRAAGVLSPQGDNDFSLSLAGLHVDRVLRLLQMEDRVAGHLDLDAHVGGVGEAPQVDVAFHLLDPSFETVAVDSVRGTLAAADGAVQLAVETWNRGRRTLDVRGRVPADVHVAPRGMTVKEGALDLRIVADSVAAASVLHPLEFLEDVDGFLSGELVVRGTPDAPEPSGRIEVVGAAWTVGPLGVRHRNVGGTLLLRPDRTLDVDLAADQARRSTVKGRVVFEPVDDPSLDLRVALQAFPAVGRRDVAGAVSGDLTLSGTYQRPVVEGNLTVDEGTLFLEEFARSTEIVDLTDPRIFEVVDTAALSTRPLLAGIRNPFLDGLRVDIDLAVPRNTWLRSSDMNVEIGGDLLVTYDRRARDLVLVGELQALRGSYVVLGRTFQVQDGTVQFVGTPGINPALDIRAATRIRRTEGDPLNVLATVEGNLTEPRVTLSSDEQEIAQSDLVSYLIFGRPSYELATGQSAFLQGAAGSFVGAAATGGVTWATGTLATRLGAAFAQQIGVDYLSVSQAGDFTVASGTLSGSFASTQVEVGQYVGEDLFFVLIFRPLADQGGGGVFGGARVEWTPDRPYTVEAFIEDRFLRSGAGGFRDLGFQTERVVGVFIFREWGY